MRYLLDTNVISELVARHPNEAVINWIDGLDPTAVYLSVITVGEIRKGIEKLPPSRRRDDLIHWLRDDLLWLFGERLVDITVDTMLTWGEMKGRLEREGHPIDAVDSLIAATALVGGFTLATRNIDDFRYTGVVTVNPWSTQ